MSNTLTPVDTQSLEAVTGGAATPRCANNGSSDAPLQTLNTLQSSIKDINRSNNGGFSNAQFLMLGLLMSQRANVNVVVRRPFW